MLRFWKILPCLMDLYKDISSRKRKMKMPRSKNTATNCKTMAVVASGELSLELSDAATDTSKRFTWAFMFNVESEQLGVKS